MDTDIDLRTDAEKAKQISQAISLLTEFGYERARQHLAAAGVEDLLAQKILLLRFDRRGATVAVPKSGVGVFRGSSAGA